MVGGTLLGAGASLAAIILSGQRALRTEIAAVETRLGKRMGRLADRVRESAGESFGPRPSPASTPDESPA